MTLYSLSTDRSNLQWQADGQTPLHGHNDQKPVGQLGSERAQEEQSPAPPIGQVHVIPRERVEQDLTQQARVVHEGDGRDVNDGRRQRLHSEDGDEADDVAGEAEGEDDPEVVLVKVKGGPEHPVLLQLAVDTIPADGDVAGVAGDVHTEVFLGRVFFKPVAVIPG